MHAEIPKFIYFNWRAAADLRNMNFSYDRSSCCFEYTLAECYTYLLLFGTVQSRLYRNRRTWSEENIYIRMDSLTYSRAHSHTYARDEFVYKHKICDQYVECVFISNSYNVEYVDKLSSYTIRVVIW